MKSTNKTKKKKKFRNKHINWDLFKSEITDISDNSDNSETSETIKCIYDKSDYTNCNKCNSLLIIGSNGFPVCSNNVCGICYTNILDCSAEWSFYNNGENNTDPTRCGMPINPLLKESSYGCKVLAGSGGSYEMRKIKRYTDWLGMPYKEKSQYDEFQKISIIGAQAGIPKLIIDDALRYHKKISEVKTFRGLNRDGILAASIYISASVNKFPRSAKEIAGIFKLDQASATKGCKNAVNIINNLESELSPNEKIILHQTTPDSFIDRYCSKLEIKPDIMIICKFIAVRVQQNSLIPENTPNSIAAGIIYFIVDLFKLNITKQDISIISEISEVTINKCYKKLSVLKKQLIPENILLKYCND